MKSILRLLTLSALVLVALLVARTFGLPSNEFGIPDPQSGPGAPGPVEAGTSGTLDPPVLTATPGNNQITINWQPVTNAVRYLLYVRKGFVPWQQLGDGSLTDTSFIDFDVTAGSTYAYTGRAISSDGTHSPWAKQVEAEAISSDAPAAPALVATAGLSKITITWQPVEGAATYEIWVQNGNLPPQQLDNGALTATTFTHTGFKSTGAYQYTGRSVSSDGTKSLSSPQISATLTDILPVPDLTATGGEGQITLTWQSVTGADTYHLWAWESTALWKQLDDGPLTDTSFIHSDLPDGRTYYYTIRAVASDGAKGPPLTLR